MDSAINAGAPPKQNWVSTFTGVLLAPIQTMRQLAASSINGQGDMGGAFITVCLAFALDGLRLTSPSQPAWSLLNVPASLFFGIMLWLTLAGTLALVAACFNTPRHQIHAIFVTTGWSFAPWLLTAPIWCYRDLSGSSFVLFSSIPLIWTFITQICAIKETFEMKPWQTFVLIFAVPTIYSLLSMMQLAQAAYVALAPVVN